MSSLCSIHAHEQHQAKRCLTLQRRLDSTFSSINLCRDALNAAARVVPTVSSGDRDGTRVVSLEGMLEQ